MSTSSAPRKHPQHPLHVVERLDLLAAHARAGDDGDGSVLEKHQLSAHAKLAPMKPLFLFMAVVFAAGQSFAANRFGALVEGYSNPKAGASAAVSNVDYSFGHLKLNLASGNAAPVTAAGNTVAIFFTGNGTFTYVSDDPVEFPIVTRNTRGESHLKLDTSGKTATISGPVSEVLLYAAG